VIGARILLVGGTASELCMAAGLARELGADVSLTDGIDQALDHVAQQGCDLVLAEIAFDIAELIRRLRAERIATPVLACGVSVPAELAVAAVRAGARDYVPLPPSKELIATMLRHMGAGPMQMLGDHPRFRRAVDLALSLASSPLPMLINGEPGSGRQLLAWHVHQACSATGRLIRVDCANSIPDLFESDLFDHRAGASAGASEARTGAVAQSSGSTLLVRDVQALPLPLQARLLGVIESRSARVIATTAADLRQRHADGLFRGDLLERFEAAWVSLPPLRARGDDLDLLVRQLAAHHARQNGCVARTFADDCWPLLRAYGWPGNVRELDGLVRRAVLLSFGEQIPPGDLLLENGRPLELAAAVPVDALVGRTVEDVERSLILETLERCRGNRTSASQMLGISVRTMRNKLKTFMDAGFPVSPAA